MSVRTSAALAATATALALSGCVTVPTGPAVAALPGTYKPLDQFRVDDADCRQFASTQTSGDVQGANDQAAGTAFFNSALGAASGAIFGSISGQAGPAAAIGAGMGLLFGGIAAANQSYANSYGLQQRYDGAYSQCMYGKGNQIAVRAPPRVVYQSYPANPPPDYQPAPSYPGYPPPAGAPPQ